MKAEVPEFNGPNEVALAAEYIYTEPKAHLAVVRGLLPETVQEEMIRRSPDERTEIIRNEIPELDKVDALTEAFWEEFGYTDHVLEGGLHYCLWVKPGKSNSSHIDTPLGRGTILAGINFSISKGGSARFEAKKPKKPTANPDGSYNQPAWNRQYSRAKMRHWFPAAVIQHATDGVMFAQHPYSATHKVTVEPNRTAMIIDRHAIPVSTA